MCSNISWAVEQLRASKTCAQPTQTTPVKDQQDRGLSGADQKLSREGLKERPKPPPPEHPAEACTCPPNPPPPSSFFCFPRGAQAPLPTWKTLSKPNPQENRILKHHDFHSLVALNISHMASSTFLYSQSPFCWHFSSVFLSKYFHYCCCCLVAKLRPTLL